MLSVSDTDTGISAHHLPHIFETFFTLKEIGSRTGLGLSTVYEIFTQKGGYIFVESYGLGKGACFIIYFRRDAAIADDDWDETAHEDGQLGDVTGRGTVLLVEDEDPVCLFGARFEAKSIKSSKRVTVKPRFRYLVMCVTTC